MLLYHTVPVTPFQQNCSIVYDDQTREAAVIDPGGDLDLILAEVQRLGLALKQIWLTHGHIDHAAGSVELSRRLSLPIIGPHEGDRFWIDNLPQQSSQFGFPQAEAFVPSRWLADGDVVELGAHRLQVRHCPGHTPGHVAIRLASRGAQALFAGDAIHHAIQVYHPNWNSFACLDQEAARRSRRKLLEDCAGSGALLAPQHFGAPHLCHIDESGDGFTPRFA